MNNRKVSVIVPVYNAEKFLNKAIDSLVRQTLEDIEIILVDDGSTDNSPRICDDYAQRDNRIIVIHKENSGQAIARNVGLEIGQITQVLQPQLKLISIFNMWIGRLEIYPVLITLRAIFEIFKR